MHMPAPEMNCVDYAWRIMEGGKLPKSTLFISSSGFGTLALL